MTKRSRKNKKYIESNGIEHIHIILPEAVKSKFRLATVQNKTTMTDVLLKTIYKYNSTYINKYEGKDPLLKRAD